MPATTLLAAMKRDDGFMMANWSPASARERERARNNGTSVIQLRSVDKTRIAELEQQVIELKEGICKAVDLGRSDAEDRIREVENANEKLRKTLSDLKAVLIARGLGNMVAGILAEIEASKRTASPASVIHAVSFISKTRVADRHGVRRHKSLVFWRAIECWLMKQYTLCSYPKIGQMVGKRDHTTVLHHVQKVEANFETYAKEIARCEELL